MNSLIELAQRVDRLAKEKNISGNELVRHALNAYELWQKVGSSAEREWLETVIEILASNGQSLKGYFDRNESERKVVDEAKAWRKGQITGSAPDPGALARAVDALLVDDPDLSERDREHLRHLQATAPLHALFSAAHIFYAAQQLESGQAVIPFVWATMPQEGKLVIYSEFGAKSRELAEQLHIPWKAEDLPTEVEPSVHAQDHFRSLEE